MNDAEYKIVKLVTNMLSDDEKTFSSIQTAVNRLQTHIPTYFYGVCVEKVLYELHRRAGLVASY